MYMWTVKPQESVGCTSGNRATREEAEKAALEMVTYYTTECGYVDPIVTVERLCDVCHGEGRIGKSRKRNAPAWLMHWVECKNCKGTGIEPFARGEL